MTTYTKITKPSNTSYTNQNSIGKQQYDQNTISYDDSGVFYDSFNQNLYTNVAKPTGISLTWSKLSGILWSSLGIETWLILGDGYVRVTKPI